MAEDNKPDELQDKSIAAILREISEGILDGKELSREKRQECVEYLSLTEGFSPEKISDILHVSSRTIKRDKKEIKERNAQKPSEDLAWETIGEYWKKAEAEHDHLMRLSRSKEGSLQEKTYAADTFRRALEGHIKTLQSLGYLPKSPLQIEANIHHDQEEEETPAQLKERLAQLEKILAETNTNDPEILKLIETAKAQIALAEANQTIRELEKKLDKPNKEPGASNE